VIRFFFGLSVIYDPQTAIKYDRKGACIILILVGLADRELSFVVMALVIDLKGVQFAFILKMFEFFPFILPKNRKGK
jgi:hypothetical protein